jgi:hypothetical protein
MVMRVLVVLDKDKDKEQVTLLLMEQTVVQSLEQTTLQTGLLPGLALVWLSVYPPLPPLFCFCLLLSHSRFIGETLILNLFIYKEIFYSLPWG